LIQALLTGPVTVMVVVMVMVMVTVTLTPMQARFQVHLLLAWLRVG